jgi:5-methyltetrahydrofolate--homocysteine methyltransferase
VADGAWGTQLMERGLKPGESPEALNISRPEMLAEIAGLYIDAGAEMLTTNTFGGSPLRLVAHALDSRAEEINRAAVEAIRPVAFGRAHVSGSVGPCGHLLKPYGDTAPDVVAESFERQIGALVDAGADVICVETMIDLREAELAVRAARSASSKIPIIATMTFDPTPRGFHTTMGVTVKQACSALVDAGADLVGSNCGNGLETMIELAREFMAHADVPVVIQSNAGLPDYEDGELVYPESPEFMGSRVGELVALGVSVIGGCCGTGPDHIREIRSAVDSAS